MLTIYIDNLDFCYYSWEYFASIVHQLKADAKNVNMFTNLLGLVKIPDDKKKDYKLLFHSNSMYICICINAYWINNICEFVIRSSEIQI